jgi:hypothetical protein
MRILAIALALSVASIPVAAFSATDPDAPVFAKGPVWDFAFVKTQDGHSDEYIQWLSTRWREQQEALKKAGYISDYKVLMVSDPRNGEADLILATEYPNMAAFDRSADEEYAMQKQIWGSIAKANEGQVARGSIRTIQGDILTREVRFK